MICFTFSFKAINSDVSSADLVVEVVALLAVSMGEGEAVVALPAIVDALRAVFGTVVGRVVRAVVSFGNVDFLAVEDAELVEDRTVGVVVFRVTEGLAGVVGVPVLETSEDLLVTPGVAVARVVPVALATGVAGVFEARTEAVVGFGVVVERTDGVALVVLFADFVMGVLEALTVADDFAVAEAFAVGVVVGFVPARPAAASEDIRFLEFGKLSAIGEKSKEIS